MLVALADTHAVIWYLMGDKRLSAAARAAIDDAAAAGQQVGFSALTIAEVLYLTELGRVDPQAWARLNTVLVTPTVLIAVPFDPSVALAMASVPRAGVPELPDRIITATALRYGLPLITRDVTITTAKVVPTLW